MLSWWCSDCSVVFVVLCSRIYDFTHRHRANLFPFAEWRSCKVQFLVQLFLFVFSIEDFLHKNFYERVVAQFIATSTRNLSSIHIFGVALNQTRIAGFVGERSPNCASRPWLDHHLWWSLLFYSYRQFISNGTNTIIIKNKFFLFFALVLVRVESSFLFRICYVTLPRFRPFLCIPAMYCIFVCKRNRWDSNPAAWASWGRSIH